MALTKQALEIRRDMPRTPDQFRLPLFLFGIGLGGFVDGIVLDQILQWHHMISDTDEWPMTTVVGLEANTLADGLFHAFALVVVLVALYLVLRVRRSDAIAVLSSSVVVTGWLLIGWGAFNIVEGVVDHHLLTVHHVRDDVADPLAWDLSFLGISVVLLLVGLALVRRGSRSAATSHDLATNHHRTFPPTTSRSPGGTMNHGYTDTFTKAGWISPNGTGWVESLSQVSALITAHTTPARPPDPLARAEHDGESGRARATLSVGSHWRCRPALSNQTSNQLITRSCRPLPRNRELIRRQCRR